MEDNKNLTPELEEPWIITLTDEETGEEKDFELYARCTIDDNLYLALVPADDEGDEYVILRATVDGDDMILETIEDDDEFDEIAEIFEERLSEYYEINEVDSPSDGTVS